MISVRKLLKKQSFKNLVPKYSFSTELNVPVIDLDKFMNKTEGWKDECKKTAECLHETGILLIKDSVNIV